MWQPADGEEAGRIIGQRLLDDLSADRPELHVVLISHFLVGHGQTHRNAKSSTWGLHALEAHVRGGRNPWTILRPTWLSTIHDPSYQTRLSQDRYAAGPGQYGERNGADGTAYHGSVGARRRNGINAFIDVTHRATFGIPSRALRAYPHQRSN